KISFFMQFSGYSWATVYITTGFMHFLYFLNKYSAPLFSRGLWRNQPAVKTNRTNGQHLAHLLYGIYLSVLFYEPVYEPSPLEKMAMAFFNMSRSSSVSLSFLRKILNSCSSELILGLSRSVLPPLKRGFLRHLLSRLGSTSNSLATAATEPLTTLTSTAMILNESSNFLCISTNRA